MSTRRTIARNTLFNAAGRTWEALLALLVLTPYVVPRVGLAAWGAWALLSAFTGYVALFDLGISSAYAKYIAGHAARKEEQAISRIVSTGFFFYLFLGVLLIALGWPAIDLIIGALGRLAPARVGDLADAGLLADLRFLLRWALVLFCASNCVSAFTAVQTGLQRMGITNVQSFVASLVKLGATIGFIETGHGVRGLLYAEAAAFGVFGAASIVAAFRLVPSLRVSPRWIELPTLGRLFGFGWKTQVSRLANLIMFQTDKVIAGLVFLGQLHLVGLYELGLLWANKSRQIPGLLLTALVPAVSDLDARGEEERLRELYLRGTKYVAFIGIPASAFLVGAAGPLMRAWMGDVAGLDTAAWVLRIIALGYVANVLPGPGVTLVLGKGRPGLQMNAGLIAMIANIALTLLLVYAMGFYGIPIATALSMFLSCGWFFVALEPVTGLKARAILRGAVLWPCLAAAPGLAVAALGDWLSSGLTGRVPNAAVLLGTGAWLLVSYLGIMASTRFFDAFDAAFIMDTLHLGRVPGVGAWLRRRRHA